MRTMRSVLIGIVFAGLLAGQTPPGSTALAGAVGTNDLQIPLVSVTGITPGTILFADREAMHVFSVVGSSAVVRRGSGPTRASAHTAATTVYFGAQNQFLGIDPQGACSAPSGVFVTLATGNTWSCTAGSWVQQNGGGGGVTPPPGNVVWASRIPGVVLDCNVVNGLKTGTAASDALAAPANYAYRGAWAAGTAYNQYDAALSGGANWVAAAANTGVTPGSDPTKWAPSCDSATNNTAALNAVLATATATHPVYLVMDGGSAITGLILPALGHVTIDCPTKDAGFWMRSGSNANILDNGFGQNPTGAIPTAMGANVTVKGCYLNGHRNGPANRGSNPNFPFTNSSVSTDPGGPAAGPWLVGIALSNLTNISIEGVTVSDAPTYAALFDNAHQLFTRGNRLISPSSSVNTDGWHVNGPASDVTFTGDYFVTGDDAVALNGPEGYGGSLSNITMTGLNFESVNNMVRIYENASYYADNIVLANSVGFANTLALLGTTNPGDGKNHIRSFLISNCELGANYSSISVNQNVGLLEISNVALTQGYHSTYLFSLGNGSTLKDASVTSVRTFTTNPSNFGQWVGGVAQLNGGTIGRLAINDYSLVTADSGVWGTVPYLLDFTGGGTISEVTVNSLNPFNITTLASGAGITLLDGAGLAQTGWNFADSIVGNGSNYLSAGGGNCTAGHLCVKVGGVTHQYF